MNAELFCRFLPATPTHRYALTSDLFPAGAPLLFDSQLSHGQLGKLFRFAHAALADLYDLFGDKLRDGIASFNQPELAQGLLVSLRQDRYLLRAHRRILQQAIDSHCRRRPMPVETYHDFPIGCRLYLIG